jgi:tetratricopeptide (TPR) repeat protein
MGNKKDKGNVNWELACHFIEERSYNLAINVLTKAIKIEPWDVHLYDLRGLVYGRNNEYEKAIADFDVAIEIDNQLACAYNNRAMSYFALDMIEKALRDINKAGGLALDMLERAVDGPDDTVDFDPNIAVCFANRGLIQCAKGSFQEAVLDYSLAIILGASEDVYKSRGEAYFELGEYEKSLADFNQALALNPNDITAFANSALVSSLLNR